MTVQPAPAKKNPWLIIIVGVIAALCLCVVLVAAAYFMFIVPARSSTVVVTETPAEAATVEVHTAVPTQASAPGNANPLYEQAAPAGTPVGIGNKMTLTILGVTRPVDEAVAEGSVLNAEAPEGEEFLRVDVQVECANDPGTPCRFYPTVMKVLPSDGSTRDLQTFIEGVDDWDTTLDVEGGSTKQGFLLYIVPKAETELVISYKDMYADAPLYFQLR